jgi:RimJ/RimL family protein N-acetyltransferase
LKLRQARLGDLEAIRAIMDDEVVHWNGYPSDDEGLDKIAKAWIHKVRRKPYRESWVICDRSSGEILGLRTVMSDASDSRICATGGSLAPGWRGRGLGKEELATFIGLMKHLGFQQVIAASRVDNYRAISLYTKMGFSRLPEAVEGIEEKSAWMALQLPSHDHRCRLR